MSSTTTMAAINTMSLQSPFQAGNSHFIHTKLDLTTLPAEILLSILELLHRPYNIPRKSSALIPFRFKYEVSGPKYTGDEPRGLLGLLAASRSVAPLARAVLYKTVILDSPRAVALFAKILLCNSAQKNSRGLDGDIDVALYVRTLKIFFDGPYEKKTLNAIVSIIRACTRVNNLSLSSDLFSWIYGSMLFASASSNASAQPSRLTLSTYPSLSSLYPTQHIKLDTHTLLSQVTHLRVSHSLLDGFVQPLSLLRALGPLPQLTHLALTRRIGRNEDNDRIFAEDIIALHEDGYNGNTLKLLVVCLVWENGMSDLYSSQSSTPYSSASSSEYGDTHEVEVKPEAFIYALLSTLLFSSRLLIVDIDASAPTKLDGSVHLDPAVVTPIHNNDRPFLSVPASFITSKEFFHNDMETQMGEEFWLFAQRQIAFKKLWTAEFDA